MGNVNYTPLYDKFPDSKYDLDHLALSLDSPAEKSHKIHYKKKYKNFTNMDGSFQKRICVGIGGFDFGECMDCGKKWYEEDQRICEGCGVDLSRL